MLTIVALIILLVGSVYFGRKGWRPLSIKAKGSNVVIGAVAVFISLIGSLWGFGKLHELNLIESHISLLVGIIIVVSLMSYFILFFRVRDFKKKLSGALLASLGPLFLIVNYVGNGSLSEEGIFSSWFILVLSIGLSLLVKYMPTRKDT